MLVETMNEGQGRKLTEMKTIRGKSCNVQKHNTMNTCQGIIYVYEYDIQNIQSFKEGLQKEYPIVDVAPATWLKPKNLNASAFIDTFELLHLPDTLRIPGERPTKVYKYYNRPMFCQNCLCYMAIPQKDATRIL